jgi:hypothetical protein
MVTGWSLGKQIGDGARELEGGWGLASIQTGASGEGRSLIYALPHREMAAYEPGAVFPELDIPAELMQMFVRDYGNRNKTLAMLELLANCIVSVPAKA